MIRPCIRCSRQAVDGRRHKDGGPPRSLTYDNAGNLLSDSGTAGSKSYVYNNRNRLSQATVGALVYNYTYNALEQLVIRAQVSPAATTHFIHDRMGNVIAETAGGGPTGATGTVREYIWLPETEIAPTMSSRTVVDRPLAVVDAVNTASPLAYWVSVDHLNRPVKMTNAAKASVWDAVWLPWGGVQAITGTATLNARFPGQWFQSETGLHYNWHRQYDPTLGRYTQPDPLGFVNGPSVYGYAGGSPHRWVDRDGRFIFVIPVITGLTGLTITATDIAIGTALAVAVSLPGDERERIRMPPITRPLPPGGGRCSCACRAGDASDITTFRFARSTLPTCAAAAIDSCKRAVNYCPTGSSIHHVQAACSDGSNRGGDGNVAR